MGTLIGETHRFEQLRRVSMDAGHVFRTYGAGLGLAAIALIPGILVFATGWAEALRATRPNLSFLLFAIGAGWPVVVLGWVNNRINRVYESAAAETRAADDPLQQTRSDQSAPRR